MTGASPYDWSRTAASNSNAAPNGWAAGMAPSDVEPTGRQTQASVAELAFCTVAGGSADALTVTPVNTCAALVDGMEILVRATAANATTTPTLNYSALGAKTITKLGGQALAPGDIPGSLSEQTYRYNLANTRWELLNPALGGTPLQSYLAGLTLSNDGVTPNTIIDISAGQCADSTNAALLVLGAFTKTTGSWASGTGNGGLDTGAVGASTWYHIYVIGGPGKSVDALISTSASAPTMPSGYTLKRRIGSIKTDGSSHIITFSQNGDEFLWSAPAASDFNTTATTANRTLATMNVPTGIKINVLFHTAMQAPGGGSAGIVFTSPDESDTAAGVFSGDFDLFAGASAFDAARFNVRTNTSAQIGYRGNVASTNVSATTFGWIDTRGRLS